ncbi:TPA: NAD(P)H-dependent oxidoreductase [Escherichia coli]|uniref:FMN-dependent NADH-azoreductase n=1 Tax=Pseudomonadota TaxID=1224 RepID=UPI00287CC50A|nr:NAD(P)H-dependent oxidoreductase [Escherichia coli]HEA1241046.1 NAD(P)H-dependent oxidoreductase [Escherichia coli]HEA1933025.1 NAD(P)H-dependent oxidoreductase [Escherichia coli]HEA2340446.1 NAD(P)H-dependent oxidoreductase [Escherichia coli]
MKLLHLDSSILGQNSVSRQLSADVVKHITTNDPTVSVQYRDLAADPIPHLSGAYLAAARGAAGEHDGALQHDLALSSDVLEEFLAADIVVVGVALYNFTISSQLKAWVDRIAVAGKTFRYTEAGSVGLAGDKKVVLAVARGGFYSPGSPAAAVEHAETYMRAIFGFVGVTDLQTVIAEGLNIGPEQRTNALDAAAEQIASLTI